MPASSQQHFASGLRARDEETLRRARRGLWLTFLGAFGLEVVADLDVGWVGVDLQHGDLELTDVPPLLRVADRVGLPLLARTASDDPAHLARVLDTGVAGVVVPQVSSAAQAAAVVAASRVPPAGHRSTGLSRAGLVSVRGPGSGAPAEPLVVAMVETRQGVAEARQIAGTPGLDGVMVGPYDLALSLGCRHPSEASVLEAVRDVVEAAHEAGRVAGAFAGDRTLLTALPPVELLAVDSDAAALRAGVTALLES